MSVIVHVSNIIQCIISMEQKIFDKDDRAKGEFNNSSINSSVLHLHYIVYW